MSLVLAQSQKQINGFWRNRTVDLSSVNGQLCVVVSHRGVPSNSSILRNATS